jgi:uncharacterized protein YaaQ
MKLILAVVQNTDADAVMDALVRAEHRVTRIASTGGFFRQGNTTLLVGVQDEQVGPVIDILRGICQRRTRLLPVSVDPVEPMSVVGGYVEVPVGGASVFVFDVERFERI